MTHAWAMAPTSTLPPNLPGLVRAPVTTVLMAHPGPHFSVHDVYVGWAEGFRDLGLKVAEFNLGDRLTFYELITLDRGAGPQKALSGDATRELAVNGLCAALYRLRPDVLFVVSAFFYPLELYGLAAKHGTRVVVLHTESPYEDDRQLTVARHVAEHGGLNLINDPFNLIQFPRGTDYAPHAYRPTVHYPGRPDPTLVCDLAFVGTGYPSRVTYLEAMHLEGLDVILAGNWPGLADQSPLRPMLAHAEDECVDNQQAADLYRSARMGLNLYRREATRPELSAGWAMGPREVEMAACGLPFLRESRSEGDQILPMLPRVTGPDDATEQLRWWLEHPDERAEVAARARAAIEDRTFRAHAARLMARLEG